MFDNTSDRLRIGVRLVAFDIGVVIFTHEASPWMTLVVRLGQWKVAAEGLPPDDLKVLTAKSDKVC